VNATIRAWTIIQNQQLNTRYFKVSRHYSGPIARREDDNPQMEPWLGEEEAAAVHDYMRSGGWLMEHDKTRKFESIIADYTGASHCIVTGQRHRKPDAWRRLGLLM
jgi:hypothetical protein